MDIPEEKVGETANIECAISQESSLPLQNINQLEENVLSASNSNSEDPLKVVTQNSVSENQTSIETNNVNSQNENIASETNLPVSTDNSTPLLPPLPKDDKGSQPSVPYSADYNMQNYSNYNYMYNYSNYYGYPFPQYQWDYNSQQYYQPYQNYYNYNYNANQPQASSKPPPPPPDTVQLPVEEKPASKTNVPTLDDSNRYSPTAEIDDDDTMKESKSDVSIEQLNTSSANPNNLQTLPPEQIQVKQNMSESVDNVVQQHTIPLITPVQQPVVPVIAQIPPYNIPVQQPSYLINPHSQIQSTEAIELTNQQIVPALNGKDDSVEKVSKGSTVLGKTQAKKRLMAFSMMKQKLQEQNNSMNDNQNSDIGEGNDVEFMPELNVFQTVTKKKVLTNKKVAKVIKAQQTIEQIEEMKKDELLQGNNAALYQHLRNGGNEAPILQKLGIESLAEKYSAKIREQDKRLKRHHHRRRDDNRRSHKYRRRSHSKSRSRSRSRSAEKPKMRALDVKSWKDFINGGFHFDKFRRFKLDETEEIKEKERKSRMKKRHGETRSDAKIQNTDFGLSTEIEKGVGIQRFNLLDRKKKILKGPEVLTQEGDYSKYYPSSITRCTKTKPAIKFSENPASATYHLQNRQQMLATLLPEIESIVHKFLSSIKPKRLKDHSTCGNYNHLDDNLLVMMKDPNIYPFKGWWPKTYFIMCQVKEDPNIEIDKDALINEFAPSKRTKKSRFNDDTSMVDIRPTVPSKWDSDYDGSPATDKVMDVEVSQNLDIITSNDIGIVIKQENNPPDISCQDEESMDTTSDACEVDPKIKVISTSPNRSQEPQVHAILDTEYEKFLKIVSAEKLEKAVENNFPTAKITKEDENNLLVKSLTSLNGDSVEDSSVKSSDDFASLHSVEEKSINDKSFVNRLSSVDIKLKKKKKMSSKKSKKNKKKESKKKKRKYSSSESSQDSESESDSSSEESDSETTDSTSSVEKKKYKSKDKKKNKSKHNLKKKNKSLKNKIKNSDDEKDNSNILNLLEKAFNVEIKMKSLDDEELKQKKKKRKHEKKETKLNEENDDDIEKVKECLKETFTKLAKNDKVSRNQSLTCDDSTVSEVLKYLNMDEEKVKKNKKSKKSFKRKRESDISGEEITPKKSKLDGRLKIKDGEKKRKSKKKKSSEKRSFDLEEHVSKKKSKKKSKMTDSSETDDEEELEHKKMKNENVHFFGLRPNEWNIKNKSSMRGVVHHSEVKNINYTSPTNDTSGFDEEVNVNRSRSTHLSEENSCLLDLKNNQNENLGSRKVLVEKFEEREKNSCESESGEVKECNIDNDKILNKPDKYVNNELKHENDELQNTLLINDNIEEQVLNKDGYSVSKLTHNNPAVTNIIINKPIGETISYRDKVKMNLKKLSTCQHIPFVFGFSSPLGLLKPINKIEKTEQNLKEPNECIKSVIDESTLLKFDKPKVVISPEIKNKKSHEIGIQANDKVFDSRLSLEESKKLSPNSLEHLNDEEQNEQMEPNVLKNKYNDNKSRENNSVSNCRVVQKIEDHSFDTIESNSCGSDLENQNEKMYEFDNIVVKREIITSSNSTNVSKFEQHIESNMIPPQNNSFVQTTSVLKDSDSICPQISNIDLESSIIDNELIVQWTSDWSKFNSSVIQNNTNICKMNGHSELHLKKSRWDEPPKYEEINTPMSYANEHNNLKDISNSFITDNLVNKNVEFKEDFDSEEQLCEIDSVVNDTRYYSENWANEYANDCSQSYELCSSFEPHYSKMKNIKNDKIIPVDYSIYENYNPSYNYHDEHYNNWKSVDSFDQLTNVAINNDTQSSIQVGNILELLPSDNVSIDEAEILKDEVTNENVFPITSESQDSIVENEKSVIVGRDEQFFKLYQQYFQHYNQNPIKYSMSEPVLDNITEVNIKTLEKLSTQEKLNTDCKDSKTVAIPLQDRGYACLVQEDDINVYLTSDNYLAYCAIEDKCMVHIALESSSLDGVGNEVRHCFNVNQNGSTVEYWLHADLIPFHVSSDVSGVFSDGDDDVDSSKSDSGQENGFIDNNDDCEDNNKYTVEGEWEIINSVSDENVDTWLDDPCILNKYGGNNLDDVDQTVADINQEGSSSSDYDTDTSDFSDSYFETSSKEKQNITLNLYQKSSENNDKNELLNIADVEIPVDITKQPQSSIKSSDFIEIDKSAALSINLDSNIEIKNEKDMAKTTLELVTENNDNNILKLEGIKNDKMKESDVVPLKEEIVVDDLSIINKIFNQQILIKKLKVRAKEKIQEKQPDTIMVHYSDNMETVKHPFLGLFQPPTISILSKKLSNTTSTSRMPKRVTFADGIHPGDNLATSPTHDDNGRPLSPPPLKKLMREMLKFKRNMYPFKKSKVRTKFTMVNKKVATVTPSIKTTTSSVIEYYISRQRLEDLPIIDTFNNSVLRSDDSLNDTDDQNIPGKNTTPPRPARELTPVPSDSECWHDDDNIKESI